MTQQLLRRAASLGGLSLFLIAGLWADRTGGVGDRWRDLTVSVLVAWVIALVGWGIARRLSRDASRAFLVGVFALVWATMATTFAYWCTRLLGPEVVSATTAVISWSVLLLLFNVAIWRAHGSADAIADTVEVAALVLAVFALPNVRRPVQESASSDSAWVDARSETRPDVYVIVLDMRTSGEWMQREYNYDQTPFDDSLRALGFVVPPRARANYAHTQLSLRSMLSGALLDADSTFAATPEGELTELVSRHPLWREVGARGYRLTHFPTTYIATRAIAGAALTIRDDASQTSVWAETLLAYSPLSLLSGVRCALDRCDENLIAPFPIMSADALEWKLRTLQTLPDSAGPIFAFMHLLTPHEPYLYNEDCSHRRPWWPIRPQAPGVDDSVRVAYRAQVGCVDSLVLDAVSGVIKRSRIPPIILVTGDHGHARVGINPLLGITFELAELSNERIAERFAVFTALRLPGADTLLSAEPTLVELIPTIRHAIWGDSLPIRRNAPSFWSPFQRLKDFSEIPAATHRPPPHSPR